MNKIEGLKEAFSNAKIVFLTTLGENGEEHTRQMTNYNENPYETMWFPTFKDTGKIEDIKQNPKVIITFPGLGEGRFFEIVGEAELASDDYVRENWKWWYLYWHPGKRERFSFRSDAPFTNRAIINVNPIRVKTIEK
jgi:general stress protein 26